MSTQSEEMRLWMRNKCLSSSYFFAKVIFGFNDLDPDMHGPVCLFLERPEKRKLLVLPRGHLKTSIATIAYPTWRATKDPNVRILISNATATNAQNFLRAIGQTLRSSYIYHWLFPELIPDWGSRDTRWNAEGLQLKRTRNWPEATIECIGVGGTAVSRHYDIIIEDDLVNEDHIKTSEVMQGVVEWHKYAESLAISPGQVERLLVGTRWAFNDVISHVLDHEKDYIKMIRSVLEDGHPIWPQRFPLHVINAIRERQGPKIFSCQYMNNPVHDDTTAFNPEWFRRYDTLPTVPLKFFTAIDPAISEKRGDYSAIVVVATDPNMNLYIADVRRGRWGVDRLCDEVINTYITWGGTVAMETVMFQKALMWPLREAMRRRGVTFNVESLATSSSVMKEVRIASLHTYFANGTLWIRSGMTDLERELLEFPVGSHDDMIDALAYAVQMAKPATAYIPKNENPFGLDAVLAELLKRQLPQGHFNWTWHKERSNSYGNA